MGKPDDNIKALTDTIKHIMTISKLQIDYSAPFIPYGNAPKQTVLDVIEKSQVNDEEKETIVKWTEKHHEVKNTIETLGNLIPNVVTLLEEAVVDDKEPTTQGKKDIKAKLIHFIKEKTKTCCSALISKLETWINEHEEELTPTELISGTINEIMTKLNIVTKEQGKEDKELKEKIVTLIKGSKLDNKKVDGILEWINFKTIDQEKIESVKDVITKLIEITKDTTFEEMTYQEIIDREKTILKQTKLDEELVSEIIEWIDAYEKPENKLHGITETIQQILKVTKIQTDEKSIT